MKNKRFTNNDLDYLKEISEKFKIDELAQIIGFSEQTIRRYIKKHNLKYDKRSHYERKTYVPKEFQPKS
jgi:DeoR/GlpR family transcriptional regulator of sugar metabolism